MKMFKAVLLLWACACAFLGGCRSDDVKLTMFHIATLKGVNTGLAYKQVVMPFTGTRLIMNTQPVLYTGDIEGAQAAEVTMPTGEKIPGFNFILTQSGTRKLTTATASNIGSYIVMLYGGQPVGLRIIDEVITNGRLFVCSEFSDPQKTIHDIVSEINDSIDKVNKIKKDN